MAILRLNKLGRQGNDALLARRHQHRRDSDVAVQCLAIGELGLRAARAKNLLGRKEIRTIKRNQECIVERTKSVQQAMAVQIVPDLGHEWRQRLRRHRIECVANLVVAWDVMDPEQGGGVVLPLKLLHADLAVEKRRTLGEENRKRCECRILDFVASVVALVAGVRQPSEHGTDPFDQAGSVVWHRRGWGNSANVNHS